MPPLPLPASPRKTRRIGGLTSLCWLLATTGLAHAATIVRPKVLVVATYEIGRDRGDTPGELQYWVERQKLDITVPVPGLDHPLLTNGSGLYAMVSGTTARCAVQMMALAMNPTFDLSHTYILLSGIGGADPATLTVGSAVWIRQVIDGDPAFELDSREIPAAWPYGTVALGTTEPGKVPANVERAPAAGVADGGSGGVGKIVYDLNPTLVDWAYRLTRQIKLADSPALEASRARFTRDPIALQPPRVIEGDSLGANRFWHGAIMNRWAEDWVRLYTRGKGSLAIADCEDQGLLLAVEKLGQLGRVDPKRLLVLRTASNFTVPPPGVAPATSLFENLASSPGYLPSLEANYQVGSVVTGELLLHWDQYHDHVP
jgi:purine nucleoside permease